MKPPDWVPPPSELAAFDQGRARIKDNMRQAVERLRKRQEAEEWSETGLYAALVEEFRQLDPTFTATYLAEALLMIAEQDGRS